MCPEYGATRALLPGRRRDAALPRVHRSRRTCRPRGALRARNRACSAQRRPRSAVHRGPRPRSLDGRAVDGRASGPRTGSRCRRVGSFVGAFRDHLEPDPKGTEIGRFVAEGGTPRQDELPGEDGVTDRPAGEETIGHGSVVIAAITSCTNTSNPSVMLAAGLLARKAVEAGLDVNAVGARHPRAGLARRDRLPRPAGLTPYLDKLGFALVGYGCTTCIGNSGPLPATSLEPSTSTTSSSRPCSRATATSRAASTRRCGRTTSRRRRSSSRTRSRAASTSTSRPNRSARADGTGVPARHLADASRCAGRWSAVTRRNMFTSQYDDLRRRRALAGLPTPAGRAFAWAPTRPTSRSPRSSSLPVRAGRSRDIDGAACS